VSLESTDLLLLQVSLESIDFGLMLSILLLQVSLESIDFGPMLNSLLLELSNFLLEIKDRLMERSNAWIL
jgi:hypothetical protein